MKQENEVLKFILETLPYSIFWKDRQSVYLGCNRLFADCAGLKHPDDIIGMSDYDLPWKREETEAYRADDAEVMRLGKPKLHIIESQVNSSGQYTWLDTSKVPLRDSAGNISGILGIYADITEQKRNQTELERFKDYLHEAIETISAGFVLYDKDDRLVVCNEPYRNSFRDVKELIVPGVEYRTILTKYAERNVGLLSDNQSPEDWASHRLKQHHRVDADWIQELPDRVYKISDRHTNDGGVVSLRTDITDERKAAEELREAKERAELASETKSRFLANMSHEIRTPMSGIIGLTDLLSDSPLNSEQKEWVESIQQSSKSLLRIVNDILDLSKIEAERVEIEPVKFEIAEVIKEVINTYSAVAHERHIEFLASIDPTLLNQELTGDRGRIAQILNNLIGNAVKFTPNKGWIVVQAFSLGNSESHTDFRISVTDSGIGIPASKLDAIFAPFAQADETTTRRFGGTGLGLTISQRLANLMGGEIKVNSRVGCGSVFYLELQLPKSKNVSRLGKQKSLKTLNRSINQKAFEGKRILLAEDNIINQLLLRKILEKLKFEVFVASNGREAYEIWSQNPFDLIITDIQMPIMDGTELAHKIKKEGSNIPIIAITAHAMKGDREAFLAQGLDDYVTKPIDKNDLKRVLFNNLEGHNKN